MLDDDYNDDNAMTYEFFIRKAHHCGRHGMAGADADTFRRLLRLSANYNEKKTELSLRDYIAQAGEVTGYIKTAIQLIMSKATLTDEQFEELEQVLLLLHSPDLNKINKAVAKADEVFSAIGLQPS